MKYSSSCVDRNVLCLIIYVASNLIIMPSKQFVYMNSRKHVTETVHATSNFKETLYETNENLPFYSRQFVLSALHFQVSKFSQSMGESDSLVMTHEDIQINDHIYNQDFIWIKILKIQHRFLSFQEFLVRYKPDQRHS